jgi:hypothetical protein
MAMRHRVALDRIRSFFGALTFDLRAERHPTMLSLDFTDFPDEN